MVEKVQGVAKRKKKCKFVCTIAVVIPEREEKNLYRRIRRIYYN